MPITGGLSTAACGCICVSVAVILKGTVEVGVLASSKLIENTENTRGCQGGGSSKWYKNTSTYSYHLRRVRDENSRVLRVCVRMRLHILHCL